MLLIHLPHPVLRLATGLLEPVEHLCRRVDLVVVPASRESRQLVQVFGEPCGLFGRYERVVRSGSKEPFVCHDMLAIRELEHELPLPDLRPDRFYSNAGLFP
jgi:hypothetical protein